MSELIAEYRPKLRIVPIYTGEPQSRVAVIFDEKKGILEWPAGPQGDKGPDGVSPTPWRIVGYVTSAAGLPTGLGPDDEGKAWANTATKAVHVWQGYRWHDPIPTGLSRPGDAGPPVRLWIGDVETLPTGSNVEASITGDAPDRVLSLGIPRGNPGDKGPTLTAPRLTKATDYVGLPPTEGQSLAWVTEQGGLPAGWVSASVGGALAEWSITDAEIQNAVVFGSATLTTPETTSVVIASVELTPLPVPYRLCCEGMIGYNSGAITTSAAAQTAITRVTVDVDHGPGPVRIGAGRNDRLSTDILGGQSIVDRVMIAASYASKLTPESPEGVVPANTIATVTVTMSRTSNVYWQGAYTADNLGSEILLMGMPV